MKRPTLGLALATLASTLVLGAPASAQQIDTHEQGTEDSWYSFGNYNYGVDANGNGSGPDRESFHVGETFVSPTGLPVLDAFSFWVQADPFDNPTQAIFRAFVLEWDNASSHPTGLALYTSELQHGTGDADTWTEYTFSTGGLMLDPSKQYLALLSSVMEDGTESADQYAWNLIQGRSDTYAEGSLVYGSSDYLNPTESASVLTDFESYSSYQHSTYSVDPSYDAGFAASFSSASSPTTVTPEPVSMALLGTGLFGVGVARRRRRKEHALA